MQKILAMFVLVASVGFGCSYIVGTPADSLKQTTLVFVGKVVQVEKIPQKENSLRIRHKVTFSVSSVFKGDPSKNFEVSGDLDLPCSASQESMFRMGHEYIVFAYYPFRDNSLTDPEISTIQIHPATIENDSSKSSVDVLKELGKLIRPHNPKD